MATEDLLVTLGDLGTVFSYKANKTVIADVYNASATYSWGDYCIYGDVLYKCNGAISTPEAWTPGHWTPENVTTELKRSSWSLTPSAAISIPSAGNSKSYYMDGLTAAHILVSWGFSASAENAPPANLTWSTHNGYFTIINSGGTTAETIMPVFAMPSYVNVTPSS